MLTAHICTMVPISKTVGANRIIPAVSIPHPLGDPMKTAEEEKHLRRSLVEKALEAVKTQIQGQKVF